MEQASHYLAFDLGASSGRAILGRLSGGQMKMEELHRFETSVVKTEGHLSWDIDQLWQDLQVGVGRALEEAPNLRSLSVDSWGVDYVPLDKNMRPVRSPYSYRDARTKGQIDRALEKASRQKIYEATGIQFMEINTLCQLLADQVKEPETAQKTALYLPIADYFNFRFSGRPVTEQSLASTTQLLDVRKGHWAEPLMASMGLDADLWPTVVPSGTRLGALKQGSSVEVVAGCSHDTACAVAAVPADPETNWAYASCGTWSLLGLELDEPVLTPEARQANVTNEVGLGGSIRLLKNITGLWVLEECIRAWKAEGWAGNYQELMQAAEKVSSEGAVLDLDEERFSRPGDMPNKIRRYCQEQDLKVPNSQGALVRCILRSLAKKHHTTLKKMEQLTGQSSEVLHIVGGGAKNHLLCQWTADACGCKVVAGPAEATALGNLLIQAHTMGDLPQGVSIREIAQRSTDLKVYQPNSNCQILDAKRSRPTA